MSGIKRGNFSPEEDELIIRLYSLLGGRWSLIAGRLSGRTDNEIKNHWHTNLSKKLRASGIKPKSKKSNAKRTTQPVTTKKSRQNKEEKCRRQGKKSRKTDNLLQKEVEKHESHIKKDEVEKIQVHIPKPIRLIPHRYSYSSSSQSNYQENSPRLISSEEDKIEENDEIYKKFQLFDELLNGCDNNISSDCIEANMLKEVYKEYFQLLYEI